MMIPFTDRPLAITDLETTGDVPSVHEILEIGLEKEPMPHFALNGAMKAREVMKALLEQGK